MVLHWWLVWQRVSSEVLLDTLGEGINESLDNLIAGGTSRGILVGAAWRERTREKGGEEEGEGGEKGRREEGRGKERGEEGREREREGEDGEIN